MTKLSVNINKIATLRNARGGETPSVTEAAVKIQEFGAHGITIHPRPDERHITRKDVYDLKPIVSTEFNIEGNPHRSFIDMVLEVKPEAYVPSSDTFIEKDSSINDHIDQMRLSATRALLERRDAIIVASVSAIYGLGDPNAYMSMLLHIVQGDRINRDEIIRRLVEMQYTRNELEFLRGTYRIRGEIIDIFPAESDQHAIRIELFDEEVDSIRWFDPLTGKLVRKTPRVTIYPKSHYVTPKDNLERAIGTIRVTLNKRYEPRALVRTRPGRGDQLSGIGLL